MSNFRPDFNKQHILGKPPTDLNDLSTAIRWNELWIGSIDADEKININTNELPNQQGELSLDAITASGNIRQTDGYLFIPEWQNRSNLINVAEELKNIKEDLLNINGNNQGVSGVIEGINLIDINSQQYDSNTKVLTLYTDDINESQNDPGTPHLWWTDARFDAAFALKTSFDLQDSVDLLRQSQLNNGTPQQIADVNRVIPKLDNNMKIPLELLPDNIVNQPIQVSRVYSGLDAQRLAFNTANLIEGDIWKVTDGQQLSYIWKPNNWLQLTQPTNFDYIKSINQNLPDPSTNANFVRPNLPSLGNPVGNVILETKNIPEPAGLNPATSLMYFSRDRVNTSLSAGNYITLTQDAITKKTQISFNSAGLQNSNITMQDVYNAINVDGTLIKKSYNPQTQMIDIKLDSDGLFKMFTSVGGNVTPSQIPHPDLVLSNVGHKAIKFDVDPIQLSNIIKNSLFAFINVNTIQTNKNVTSFIGVKPLSVQCLKIKSGSIIILNSNAQHDAANGSIISLRPDTLNGTITLKQKIYSINGIITDENTITILGADPAKVFRYTSQPGPAWVNII